MIEENADNEIHFISPSELYRQNRPEFFSDSENITNINLPREVLAYEIEKISTNQKQDLFETLCRRLAERLICHNLIPQVGPNGGGDGKTDTETYPVSEVISERWYIPQDGWKNDEKWAFAFSAKKDWEAKIKSDIEKIVNTNRGYTKIFFISNQTISSKKKKDEQDTLIKKYGIEVIILDAVWIIDKIYENNLIELVAETLNMSDAYKTKEKRLGKNDSERIAELEEIEKRINDTNYYFDGDIQLLHDMIRSAILSRMLEKSRDEIEAKFIRAERFCNKYNEKSLLPKIIYQKAWTYINYYDDYSGFINETIKLKELINENSSNIEIEWLFNILNLYRPIHHIESDSIPNRDMIYNNFEEYVIHVLSLRSQNKDMPCSALISKTYLLFIELLQSIIFHKDPSIPLQNLSNILLESKKYVEYPFEPFYFMITGMGMAFSDNVEYDKLIDNLADILSLRESEISSGIVFYNYGIQKLKAKRFKESIIYLGKSIFKLAKEETSGYLISALIALSESYKELALPWASYNCLITAASLDVKKWYEEKIVTKRFLYIIKIILSTEIMLGRLPNIFFWYGFFSILYQYYGEKDDGIPDDILFDGCLAVRLLHIDQNENDLIYLPNILEKLGLQISSDAVLFLLGYVDEIIGHYKNENIKNNIELEEFFQKAYSQPLAEQIFFQTEFQNSDTLVLKSIIIGCNIIFEFKKDMNMVFLVEMLLALIESILATSVGKILPITEKIIINVIEDKNIDYFSISKDNKTNKIILKANYINIAKINKSNHELLLKTFWEFFSFILLNCFYAENINEYLKNLFSNERLNERLSFMFNHIHFSMSIMRNKPKIFFDYWKNDIRIYKNKRLSPVIFQQNANKTPENINFDEKIIEDMPHNKFEIKSIIDNILWDKATWRATGFLTSPEKLGLALVFEDFDEGKKIFEDWKNLIGNGNIDKDELIDITIIKGINKHNPYWYRVVITTNQDKIISDKDKIYFLKSRINEMNPDTGTYLNMFEQTYKHRNKYILFPSSIKKFLPEHIEYGIQKTKITIKNAWQIGIDDQNQVAIDDDDEPILPEGIYDIPILSLLKQKREKISK
jgi:hypothetical protein